MSVVWNSVKCSIYLCSHFGLIYYLIVCYLSTPVTWWVCV